MIKLKLIIEPHIAESRYLEALRVAVITGAYRAAADAQCSVGARCADDTSTAATVMTTVEHAKPLDAATLNDKHTTVEHAEPLHAATL